MAFICLIASHSDSSFVKCLCCLVLTGDQFCCKNVSAEWAKRRRWDRINALMGNSLFASSLAVHNLSAEMLASPYHKWILGIILITLDSYSILRVFPIRLLLNFGYISFQFISFGFFLRHSLLQYFSFPLQLTLVRAHRWGLDSNRLESRMDLPITRSRIKSKKFFCSGIVVGGFFTAWSTPFFFRLLVGFGFWGDTVFSLGWLTTEMLEAAAADTATSIGPIGNATLSSGTSGNPMTVLGEKTPRPPPQSTWQVEPFLILVIYH